YSLYGSAYGFLTTSPFSYATDVLIASGVPTLNGANWYPVKKAWHIFDPQNQAIRTWNRYANVLFFTGRSGDAPGILLGGKDEVLVFLDPFGSAQGRLGIEFIVSEAPLARQCLRLDTTGRAETRRVYIYRRLAS